DVQMPGMSGFEVCQHLKANPATQAIPIIFATAAADMESKSQGFALGAVDYIAKPFEQAEALARVRVHLQLKRLTESLEEKVQERTSALQKAQVQIVQQEKLSGLGEMVAGIAHELNNPINFIASNVQPLKEYIAGVKNILNLYQKEHFHPSPELEEAMEDLDLDFVIEDMEKILGSFTLGVDRIKNISTSLRTFSRSDRENKVEVNIHECLDSTLTILQHRLKGNGDRPRIEVFKSYEILPPILCYPGQIGQVFMNILANAIDALEEAAIQGKISDPQIEITTRAIAAQKIEISIADNGSGIPKSIQERLFEPLFTTKPVGKGTGLGLAIARQIITEKHAGHLACISDVGKGTQFVIDIPTSRENSPSSFPNA
ncbi:MAG: HAMP domain-containing histidine kinase, partial [Spirulina sp. SIO3F2]|nr:HAMP domain-containing histidine kinase [Spirulina sp. SIO3F2]